MWNISFFYAGNRLYLNRKKSKVSVEKYLLGNKMRKNFLREGKALKAEDFKLCMDFKKAIDSMYYIFHRFIFI